MLLINISELVEHFRFLKCCLLFLTTAQRSTAEPLDRARRYISGALLARARARARARVCVYVCVCVCVCVLIVESLI